MKRSAWCVVSAALAMAIGLGAWVAAQPPAASSDKEAAAKPAAPTAPWTRALCAELARPVRKPAAIDPNFPFRLTLDYLTDLYDLPPIHIDYAAYRRLDYDLAIDAAAVERGVKAEQGAMTLGSLLQTILDRLPAVCPRSTYMVRDDGILIVPWSQVHGEVWGHDEPAAGTEKPPAAGRPRQMLPLVHVNFQDRPLVDALNELAEKGQYSIVLDGRRARENARAAVTALLANVPIDTAVQVLANQADLKVVRLDSVFYVTTPENVGALRSEYEALNKNGLTPLPSQLPPPQVVNEKKP